MNNRPLRPNCDAYTFFSSMTNHCALLLGNGRHSDRAAPVIRIGREPTPGESTIQLLRENPSVLELMGQRLFAQTQGLYGDKALLTWHALSDGVRESWCDQAFALSVHAARRYEEVDSALRQSTPSTEYGLRLVE